MKSKLFIGKCSVRSKRQIMDITHLQEKLLHSNYLGAPLIIDTPRRHHFTPLLDRFLLKVLG